VRSSGFTRGTSEPRPARIGRNGSRVRGREQAPVQHPLVQLGELDRPLLAGPPEVRLQGDRVERDEAADDPAHVATGDQQPDVGSAIGHDLQVPQAGPQDGAHQRHRLAARPPAADPDRHAGAQLAGDVVGAHHGHAVTGARP